MAKPATGPFAPNLAGTVTHNATTTSTTPTALVGAGDALTVYNSGSAEVFFEQGPSTVTVATATGFVIGPGAIITIGRLAGATHIVAITSTGTATVRVTTGEGS